MSPTHTNKGGARYRYYVSQAMLQGKPQPAGLLGRVPAAEIEALVVAALRNHLNASGAGEQLPDNDLELLERHLERVTLTSNHLELRLRQNVEPAQADDAANNGPSAPRHGERHHDNRPLDQPCAGRASKASFMCPRTTRR